MTKNKTRQGALSQWTDEINDSAFLYYQGKDSTQAQAIRYLGGHSLLTTTNEKVSIHNQTIYTIPREKIWLYPELEEIDRHTRFGWFARFKYWFAGIFIEKASSAQDSYQPLYPQNETGTIYRSAIHDHKVSLAQHTDIENHKLRYDALVQQMPDVKNIILYGVSRGAATSFAAMATYQYDKVKLCVLEAPPASLRAIAKHYFPWIWKLLYNRLIAPIFLGGQHQALKEEQPFTKVKQFPNEMPLVIISSKKDRLVPHFNSYKLALAVAGKRIQASDEGQQVAPVYFIQLDKAGHNEYAHINHTDSERYQAIMHAIYRRHGLAYIEHYAEQGENELALCELTNGLLKPQIKLQTAYKQNKQQRMETSRKALTEFKKQHFGEYKDRAIDLCLPMKMYQKYPNRFGFFRHDRVREEMMHEELPQLYS